MSAPARETRTRWRDLLRLLVACGPWTAVVAGALPATAETVFSDDFDGDELGVAWRVRSPDPDAFLVEDGGLLLLSSTTGNVFDGTVPNVFELEQKVPEGDWTVTVTFRAELQTARERLSIGVVDAEDRRVTANVATKGDKFYGWHLVLEAWKRTGRHEARFARDLANLSCNVCKEGRMFPDFVASLTQPITLELRKRGRHFTARARLSGDDAEWVELEQLTVIAPPTTLVLYADQWKKGKGETTFTIDSLVLSADP